MPFCGGSWGGKSHSNAGLTPSKPEKPKVGGSDSVKRPPPPGGSVAKAAKPIPTGVPCPPVCESAGPERRGGHGRLSTPTESAAVLGASVREKCERGNARVAPRR